MNKNELIDAVAVAAEISKATAGKVVDAFTDTITKALKKGETVALIGFGTFTVSKRAAREGRNPSTGETITIPAKLVPKFSAGKKLKEAVAK